ncbi:MAG: hypothetical protein LC804_09705 [Acidobacteria bacterium]|nr:hypothetical protein [Acidobacteriota bacterium]
MRDGTAADPYAPGTCATELSAEYLIEAWNYNLSREALRGGSVGVACGVRTGLALTARAPLLYVSQRGTDGYLLGVASGVRWRAFGRGGSALFLELAVGASRAETRVPPAGTRVNYVFQTGAGVSWPAWRSMHALAGVRWLHLSNNSLAGRNRNPDIQAIGVHAGVLVPF